MTSGRFDYGQLVESALRGVVRDVLLAAQAQGIEDPHHFYITFRTDHPGVQLADVLRDRFPTEMTIVLQHEFWDLEIEDEGFRVTLSFNNQRETIGVPFTAIKLFADPGVNFGLEFRLVDEAVRAAKESKAASRPQLKLTAVSNPEDDEDDSQKSAEVVTLDTFRKK